MTACYMCMRKGQTRAIMFIIQIKMKTANNITTRGGGGNGLHKFATINRLILFCDLYSLF